MRNINYKKIVSRIEKNAFKKEVYTSEGRLEIYANTQEELDEGKFVFIRNLIPEGNGKELLYDENGKPLTEVDLEGFLPHGRMKVFDQDGNLDHNIYWRYGKEIPNEWNRFAKFEEEERSLIKRKAKIGEVATVAERDAIYKKCGFDSTLAIAADLEFPSDTISLMKKNFSKTH